ncbi:uncharacterized protein BP5553_04128 [Venustampulla echinocandica]|uniref:Zn(2)-C6 fungal-type domain-containing protein n=1 Tax=Venustampulla echinocandica TaxID=2656787 RepID=A0A370TWD4_9HELO|nr:uncharacterized protein BP5553_04128 [Venustampulla echinocandica]RDL39788.1 hypothetical protein BP5553_04128 [Venustampulla echinocandica]
MSQRQADPKKRISCKRCQDRKIKCSRTSPCQRCTAAGVRCEFRGDGMKRAPISREYVTALESRIGALESFLSDLKAAPSCQQERMINVIEFGGQLQTTSAWSGMEFFDSQSPDASYHSGLTTRLDDEAMIYPGPSSLYSSMLLKSAGQAPSMSQAPPISSTFVDVNNNFPRHIVNECLALFFRWQYLHSMLIDRDEFFLDYSNTSYTGKHISTALEHSICALGALMSSDMRIRGLADSFSAQATRILELESLLNPKETSIQALILCSLYQIGKCEFSKARMLSGIAFRMSEDITECDQSQRYLDRQPSTQREVDSRRRTVISLLLGRPAVVAENASPLCQSEAGDPSPISNNLLEQCDRYSLPEPEISPNLSTVSKRHAELCHIINDILETYSSSRKPTRQQTSQRWIEVIVNELNARLWKWLNSLPASFRWNRWGSSFNTVHPSIAALHMLYNTAHISLNLPFLTSEKSETLPTSPAKLIADAIHICRISIDTIISILRRFRSQHSLKNAPLEFVHGAITAADAAIATAAFDTSAGPLSQNANLRVLDEALLDLSYSWKIAGDARAGLWQVFAERGVSERSAISSPSLGYMEQESPVSSAPGSVYDYAASSVTSGHILEGSEPNAPNIFSFEPVDATNLYAWDQNLLAGDVTKLAGGCLRSNKVALFGDAVDEGILMSLGSNNYDTSFDL